jgi:hypothetical protein
MSKQTAVEWLVEKFAEYYNVHQLEGKIMLAKQMEKEQIRDSFLVGMNEPSKYESNSSTYYNKTYGNDKQ